MLNSTISSYFYGLNNVTNNVTNKRKINFCKHGCNVKNGLLSPEMKQTIHLSTMRFINMKIRENELKREKEKYSLSKFLSSHF